MSLEILTDDDDLNQDTILFDCVLFYFDIFISMLINSQTNKF